MLITNATTVLWKNKVSHKRLILFFFIILVNYDMFLNTSIAFKMCHWTALYHFPVSHKLRRKNREKRNRQCKKSSFNARTFFTRNVWNLQIQRSKQKNSNKKFYCFGKQMSVISPRSISIHLVRKLNSTLPHKSYLWGFKKIIEEFQC